MGIDIGEVEAGARSPLHSDLLRQRVRAIAVGPTSLSQQILEGPHLLTAVQLREASGGSAAPTFLTNSATGAAAALAPALAAQGAGTTNWVTGFQVTGSGAIAASVIVVTLTGVIGGTMSYELVIPAGVTAQVTPLQVTFPWPGLPAAAPNAAITLNVPSFGAGNTNAAATIQGYSISSGLVQDAGALTQSALGDLLDGLDAKGEEVLPFSLSLGQAVNVGTGPDGLQLRRGLWLNMTAGTIKGAIWAKYLDRN